MNMSDDKMRIITKSGMTRFAQNVQTDISNHSLEYQIDAENARIGFKKKTDAEYTYTPSLTGKSGASVTSIYEDATTNEIVFVLSEDTSSSVNTDTEPMSVQALDNTITEIELQPNVFHTIDVVGTLTVTCAPPVSQNVYTEYMLQFTTGSTQPVIIFTDDIRWVVEPNCQPNMVYQVSILNNVGVIVGAPVAVTE